MSAFSNSDLQNYRSVKRNILLLRGVALIGINSQFKCGVQQQMKNDFKEYGREIFYHPEDRRIFVAKRNQWMDWPLNFANPYSYWVIIFIALFAILMGFIRI